jgi:mono/diheme cytochrome c family protein
MRRVVWLSAVLVAAGGSSACDGPPRRPPVEAPVLAPSALTDFGTLYGTNCGGCHGPRGEGGVALGLANPIYLAIADDQVLRRATAEGVPGTAMPAFGPAAGGLLTDGQIALITRGIRERWGKGGGPREARGSGVASAPGAADDVGEPRPPAYATTGMGEAGPGAAVYDRRCASCHGAGGRGGTRAGSIVEPEYLALVSDQGLRTTIIAGRPDLGHSDWRGAAMPPGAPLSEAEVADLVAWIAAQRPRFSGSPALTQGLPASAARIQGHVP